ncbi:MULTISPECIES: tryptophan 2,3-dioxygenase [Aneurinibacillus]|uniref:Tryptophan 2,3-dioxygenase n=1 Tax=Aneurinibacillus thermoaerophilus TaxID=143495 RepID=A0A1G7YX87_ANETH|nr:MULTISPECIES: tryptophan 2,3-dioxygenase [Aneurinibacillus]AMA73158.1 tryptophan 2,3-dioxygenase [Aneurinibacillus sp. XH2]MED0674422.1 tryptophan 2,3-dioxygenase [Aneurinibacillus thermoaerophilus]MED0678439.1 tryptophan 2,3-dioxygenase [Aneurinibacillus thermoaerophilus]MED0736037.1 tryptophan 2,3-dioxygenase [Aneurinibacillus thermoaerophilus]MED0758953.1 tryptophan 2,3-dioxygenase [Aneurinibacillus thermoaerophilus]
MSKHLSEMEKERGIHTDFKNRMTYGEYLKLDQILSSQICLSDHHDEMLFIIIHQVSELWMKLILHELRASIRQIEQDNLAPAFKMLARVSKIQSQIIYAWDVLSTLTPSEYMEFRDKLGQASGFQSYQYRMIEFALGYKSDHVLKIYEKAPELLKELKQAYEAPSIYDVAIKQLAKAGFDINSDLLERDYSKPYKGDPTVEAAWLAVYQEVDKYWDLYQLAEKLIDIEDWIQQWRFRHMKTVERIIGHKMGTGGSSGVTYLKKVLDHCFFPELWNIRTKL